MPDQDDRDYDVGFKKPPKEHQFRKGRSGNPGGRPKKPKKSNEAARILRDIGAEEVMVAGRTMTKDEALLQVLLATALKGNMNAARLYLNLKEKLGLHRNIETLERRTGVLMVPSPVPLDEWEAACARQQAPFREKRPTEEVEE